MRIRSKPDKEAIKWLVCIARISGEITKINQWPKIAEITRMIKNYPRRNIKVIWPYSWVIMSKKRKLFLRKSHHRKMLKQVRPTCFTIILVGDFFFHSNTALNNQYSKSIYIRQTRFSMEISLDKKQVIFRMNFTQKAECRNPERI